MSKFKIEGVGLDTTTLDYSPSEDNVFGYLCTSVLSNNEHEIEEYVKSCSGSPLVTKIDFIDRSSEALGLHLDQIGREMVDLLLVDAKCDFLKYVEELSFLVDHKYVDVIGIYNPESVERIEEIKSVLPNLKYIGLDICPLNFNYEIISWAKDNNVDYVIDVFTPHYATDCDASVLAGYDIRHSAIGFGTSNSHGYERTHIDGIKNTYKLLAAFAR